MPPKKLSPTRFLAATVLVLCLVWNYFQWLSLTCVLMALAVACLGLIHAPQEAPLPEVPEGHPSGRGSQFFFGLVGIALAWHAYHAGMACRMFPMALWMLGAALAFRLTTFEPLPTPKTRTLGFLVLGLVLLGALFELWQAGAVPVGACTDEIAVWSRVQQYVAGLRTTYGLGADGVIPMYMLMAGLKLFGSSILGWRLEGIVCGIALTGLLYRLGKESLGTWVGLGAAFFWGVSVWPLNFSRSVYYMSDSMLVMVACLLLLTLAFRKGGVWRFAAAGLLWALCFNVYPGVRVILALIPWFYALLWLLERNARPALKRSTAPLLSGFLVGIAPLVLWLCLSYPDSTSQYFLAFTSRQGGLTSHGLLGNFNEVLSRAFNAFPKAWEILTQRASTDANTSNAYFPLDVPCLHPWLVALAVLGACVALARFRNVFYSFTLYWWFIGLLPALGAADCTERRLMMTLPPTLLLAGVGCDTLARWGRAAIGKSRPAAFVLAALALGGGWVYAKTSWKDYFDHDQRDPSLLVNNLAQYVELNRALRSNLGTGGVLISTLRYDDGSFYSSMYDNRIDITFDVMLGGATVFHYQGGPYTYDSGGVLEALNWALKQAPVKGPDKVYILLMPFYDYLAPGLEGIGATQVAEIPHVLSSKGPLVTGMDSDPTHFARLYEIADLDKAAVARYAKRPPFEEEVGELHPPRGWTRNGVSALNAFGPNYESLARSYEQGKWSEGRTVRWETDDPWFWAPSGALPGGIAVPYSLKMKAELDIPKDGDYAFGASATILTKIKVDGKTVFLRDPYDAAAIKERSQPRGPGGLYSITWYPDALDRQGFLGPSVHLTQGTHTLEIDQAFLSRTPETTHVLRPVWEAPGQKMGTLPLELLNAP